MVVFVGCDLGTMGTKAAVIDDGGHVCGEAFEEVPLRYPRPGRVEQDLKEIESSAYSTIRSALEASGRASDVAAVAFSGQMSGIGTIDDRFRPATYFDSWLDSRCTPYIDRMAEHARRVVELSGCPPTYSHGPKIVWWQHERPDEFARVARFVVPGAFVAGRMAGLRADQAFIDRTYLHFSNLSDTKAARWSDELINTFDVDARVLPRIVDPLEIVGEVTRDAGERTGLPAGTPIAAGTGDQSAAALGAGAVEPGQASDSAGTASLFAICLDSFRPDVNNLTLAVGHAALPGKFLAMAFINGGGLALRWFRDEISMALAARPDAYAELDRMAEAVPPGAGGLLWYPHFQGGVLPPQPRSRGAWVGLTAGHERGHMFRAMLEGIAYEYAAWADLAREMGQELHEARAVGGGAASTLWNSIKADVLGIDWVPTLRQECGVLGDALVAGAAAGYIDDIPATARAWQATAAPSKPDPGRHETYRQLLNGYRLLRDQIRPVFETLGRLEDSHYDEAEITRVRQ